MENIYVLSLSGGKDSYYLLLYILDNLDKYSLDYVIHAELEIDYPFIKDVIKHCKNMLHSFNIPLIIGKPDTEWFDLYKKNKFPTRVKRWCNSQYKMNAIKNAYKQLPTDKNIITYIGYTSSEKKRAERKTKGNNEIYPLIENNITESTILQWASHYPIYNDYYKYNKRCGCMFCPMMSLPSLAYLSIFYPEQYKKIMEYANKSEIELEKRYGRKISVWSGNPKYNTKYREKILKDKYIPRLQSMINTCNN